MIHAIIARLSTFMSAALPVPRRSGLALGVVLAGLATAGWSESRRVVDEADFVALVVGQTLTRMGIRVSLGADGAIRGSAFGQPVRGAWHWQGGYFCRDLFWGDRDLGANCQQVSLRGDALRFTSDRGTGRYADLTLR